MIVLMKVLDKGFNKRHEETQYKVKVLGTVDMYPSKKIDWDKVKPEKKDG